MKVCVYVCAVWSIGRCMESEEIEKRFGHADMASKSEEKCWMRNITLTCQHSRAGGGGGQKVTGSIRWAAYVYYNIIIIAAIIIQVDPGGWGEGGVPGKMRNVQKCAMP